MNGGGHKVIQGACFSVCWGHVGKLDVNVIVVCVLVFFCDHRVDSLVGLDGVIEVDGLVATSPQRIARVLACRRVPAEDNAKKSR